jgi:hypothetical protein
MPLEILAQPLLVRHLDFTHESHFQPVAARLEQLAVPPGQMLGEHVKAIFVEVPVSLDTEEDEGPEFTTLRPLSLNANYDLIRLASQVAHLRSFSMKNACRPSFFALLCIIPSSNSIQHLTLTLDTSRMPGESLDSVPHNLNRLQNLRSLKLVCYENWPTPSTSGLSLPKLQDFIWESDCENEGASVLYLDRCDMRNLGSLRIMVWCDQSVLPEGLLSIRRFVANLLQLRRLALGITNANALLPLLPSSVTELDYVHTICDRDRVALLPPSVHTLRHSATPSNVRDSLWNVLGHLANEHTYLRTISICIWDAGDVLPFFWTEGLEAMKNPDDQTLDLATFTGRLLTHASTLSRKGIKILDERGHTASMHVFNA